MSPISVEPKPQRFPPWRGTVGLANQRADPRSLLNVARSRAEGPPVRPENGIEWVASRLVERVTDRRDSVCVITGEEGESKSTLAFLLTQACDRITGNTWAPSNLCYDAENVVDAYTALFQHTLPRASVITYDEGSEGLLAGETFNPAQVVLIRTLFRARVVGAILLICIPDIWALAKKVRARRATYWLDIDKRGHVWETEPSVATVHERERSRHYLPTSVLGLSKSLRCPTLTYRPPSDDDPAWAAWDARKMGDLGSFLVEAKGIAHRQKERVLGRQRVNAVPKGPRAGWGRDDE